MRVVIFLSIVSVALLNSCADDSSSGSSRKPTIRFEQFAAYLDSEGYGFDTARTAKLNGYEVKNAVLLDSGNYVFYRLDPQDHPILRNKANWAPNQQIDYEAFAKASFVFTYHYYCKNEIIFNEDGVIEEWHFQSTSEAKKAQQEFDKIKSLVYFNTDAFSFQSGNQLYLFHTRAAAFDETLERFYNTFKKG